MTHQIAARCYPLILRLADDVGAMCQAGQYPF